MPKLNATQVKFIMDSLNAEADSLIAQAKEHLESSMIPAWPTRDEIVEQWVRLCYDKPKVAARLAYDKEDLPWLAKLRDKRSEAYKKVAEALTAVESVVKQELLTMHEQLLWDSFEESPLVMFTEDLRSLFTSDEEETI